MLFLYSTSLSALIEMRHTVLPDVNKLLLLYSLLSSAAKVFKTLFLVSWFYLRGDRRRFALVYRHPHPCRNELRGAIRTMDFGDGLKVWSILELI